MDNKLIKPYEISVWEDELVIDTNQNPAKTYYKENKIAIIGSNTMVGLNKVYEPIFTKKNNGEKTLTFSLKYQYFDPYIGATVVNPFASYLINERKVKLYYDNQWYDFIIKEHSESSDGLVWTYSAVDAFVNELSKVGYNKEFSAELGNNQGTAIELAKATVEGTDWSVDEEHSSVSKQVISEAIYDATLVNPSYVTIRNMDTNEIVSNISANTLVYLFYSYVANQDGTYVQFILQENNPNNYNIDDNNVISATNYRITNKLTYYASDNEKGFKDSSGNIILRARNIDIDYHAYKRAYNHLTLYDPVKQRVVKRYNVAGLDSEIYNYTDYIYTTSDVLVNYITNGDKFNTFDNGNLQGWQEVADYTGSKPSEVNLVTYPAIAATTSLSSLTSYSQIEGYMEVKFANTFSSYKNGIFNSGIEDNASMIESIAAGQDFIFRWRGATSGATKHGQLSQMSNSALRVVVAKYKKSDVPKNDVYVNELDTKNIILDFNTTASTLDNIIEGGVLSNNQYLIDNVPVEPSTKYIYKYNGTNYVWDSSQLKYVANGTYFHYYYMTATAKKGISREELSDPNVKIGIFIYTKSNSNYYYYLQDVQLTKLYRDADNNILTIGNVPTAESTAVEYFYIAPKAGTAAEKVEVYTSKAAIAKSLGCTSNNIKPIYNTSADKYLSIDESNSNCYNILQSIAETFECWIDLEVQHDSNGAITLVNGVPNKKVKLLEYVGKDNYAGFKYGINLNSVERTINSDEIVTKLIVTPTQSDYVDTGSVAISYASSNPSGEEYILNFDYYYNQGLIANADDARGDVQAYYNTLKSINNRLKTQERLRRDLENSLTQLNSQRTVYSTMIDEAKNNVNEAQSEFEELTGKKYNNYRSLKVNDVYYFITLDTEVADYKDYYQRSGSTYSLVRNPTGNPHNKNYYEYLADLESNDTIINVIGRMYSNSYIIQAYSGLLANLNTEYKKIRRQLRGSEEYTLTIGLVDVVGTDQKEMRVTLNDYLENFEFSVNGTSYKTDLNTKTFEIVGGTVVITIDRIPNGYKLYDSSGNRYVQNSTITANTDVIQVFTFKPDEQANGVEDVIDSLLKQKENANKLFYDKYSRFIQEGTWSSTEYIDSNLYYLDALQVSNTSAQPQISYSINVVEISELDDFKLYKFDVGDKTYVEDTEFFGWSSINGVLTPAKEEVIVAEVEWHLDEPDQNTITVQNYKTRFEDLFQRISAAVQTVQYNEATYAKTSSLMDAFGTINQTVLLNSLSNISGKSYSLTSDGSVQIDGDAITIVNLKNPANLLRLESEGLRISSDGGKTWATAITGQGINIGEVYTGSINTDKVIIGDKKNPSFRWDKAGISAYKRDVSQNVYDLQTYVRFDQYGLYGITRDSGFVASSLNDVKEKASFAVTWDGFFIKNSYTGGGRVEITSDNDFRVLKTVNDVEREVIKIGALEWGNSITPISGVAPTLYGIRITNDSGTETFKTGTDGNIEITGTINATGGNFSGIVNVGPTNQDHIVIDGRNVNYNPSIHSSNYQDGAGYGWMINKDGDAVFNNITARGAIKTAVFEYAEIQAVGGIFVFRPSSTIKSARVSGNNLILKVEKPLLFAKVTYNEVSSPTGNPNAQGWYERTNYGYQETSDTSVVSGKTYYVKDEVTNGSWCKVSNYTADGVATDSTIQNILLTNGLTHVYQISNVNSSTGEVTLIGAAAMVTGQNPVTTLEELEGGALIDMGRSDGSSNYGIGVNSSDNTVNLPRRAISLFETVINENANPKVSYKYRGILGTLPVLQDSGPGAQVSSLYNNNLAGTQGIYTDNMYLGDASQYLTFYTDKTTGEKKLRIKASQVVYEVYDKDTGQPTGEWNDVNDIETDGPLNVVIESNIGNFILRTDTTITLTCTVYQGNNDITNQVINFTWTKKNQDGSIDANWIPTLASVDGRSILVNASDIQAKAIFICEVEF